VVAGDVLYNGAHQYLAESADGGRDAWRNAIDRVRALQPQRILASHRDKNLDDDAERIMVETRQYLDDADELLENHETAPDFFNAMLERYLNRRLGAAILWAGAQALYAIRDGHDPISAVVGGWLHELQRRSTRLDRQHRRSAVETVHTILVVIKVRSKTLTVGRSW
jgi:hypothetical protein